MYKLLVFLACISAACAQGGDLASVISQIFGNSTDATAVGTAGRVPDTTPAPEPAPSTIVPPFINTTPSTKAPEPCVTDQAEQGECVRYYQCNKNNTINDDGTGLIDIRSNLERPVEEEVFGLYNTNNSNLERPVEEEVFGLYNTNKVRDGPCDSYLDVCCIPPSRRPVIDPITPKPDPTTEKRVGCGYMNPNGIGFRIKGDIDSEAKFGEFPWMVAILKVEPVNEKQPDGQKLNVYVGGGSLIHPSVVLTVAHNLVSPQELRVRAGEWDTQTKNEIYAYQERTVSTVALHKDFNKGNLFYDVGLLFLSTPVDPAPHIGVACLPRPAERAPAGARCLASGWGKDSFGKEGRYQVILKRVEVPVVDRNTCQQALRKTRLGVHFMLHTSFMCAGGEGGKDTCKGDGGSPLVCPVEFEKDRFVQNGIVSWGIGCGQDGTPGVYVDVANVRNWIDNEVAGRGFDVTSYTY